MEQEIISGNVKTAYDNFYESYDDAWRMLGAKYKALNIVDVCKNQRFLKVLEVGAGDGSILHYLDEWDFAPELHALEISESGVAHIQSRKLKKLKTAGIFDGYHIPFADNEFDLVILSHVLEHVEFERTLLREIKRVSSFQVIEVPRDYRFGVDLKIDHFLNYGHINVYTPSSLRFLLRSEGLVPVKDKTGLTPPKVTQFNAYINQKKKRSLITSARISLEYFVKKLIGSVGGLPKQEALANSYTILTRKSSDLHIF